MKICKRCGEELPLTDFHRVNGTRDGHRGKCIDCTKEERRLARETTDFPIGPFVDNDVRVPPAWMILFEVEEWKADAACKDVVLESGYEPFFPKSGASTAKQTLCAGCPVAFECLDYSERVNADDGVWGGFSGGERRQFLNSHDLKDPQTRLIHKAYLKELGKVPA